MVHITRLGHLGLQGSKQIVLAALIAIFALFPYGFEGLTLTNWSGLSGISVEQNTAHAALGTTKGLYFYPGGELDITQKVENYDSGVILAEDQQAFSLSTAFNNDGTKLFIAGEEDLNSGDLREYDLSVPYDISTRSLVQDHAIQSSLPDPNDFVRDMAISPDGLRVYFILNSLGESDVYEYALTNPYDFSTLAASPTTSLDLSIGACDNSGRGAFQWSHDGTKLYASGSSDICQFTTATPYSVAGLSYETRLDAVSFVYNSVYVSEDGTRLITSEGIDLDAPGIYYYTLDTPFDVSTARFITTITSGLDEFEGRGVGYRLRTNPGETQLQVANIIDGDGAPIGLAPTRIRVFDLQPDNLQESSTNDGSIDNSDPLVIRLQNETFADGNNDDILDPASYTINNVPTGLNPVLTLSETDSAATLTFTGNANNHDWDDDVAELTFEFTDAAFVGGDASTVFNSGDSGAVSVGLGIGIDFGDAPAGVGDNLRLWLNPNYGVNDDKACDGTVPADGTDTDCWNDLSIHSHTAIQDTGVNPVPNYVENSTNFNPGFSLNGSDEYWSVENLADTNPGILREETFADAHVYAVFTAEDNGNVLFNEDTGEDDFGVFPYYNGTHFWYAGDSGSGDDERLQIATGDVGVGEPALMTFTSRTSANTGQEIRRNGEELVSDTTADTIKGIDDELNIGVEQGQSNYFEGTINELIIYAGTGEHDAADEQQRIESYLGLKYGITLDSGVGDYVNSAGASVYNLATYNDDIVGIGRDDAGRLNQQISESANTTGILTLSTDGNFTTANGTHTALVDGQFVVVGHNGDGTGVVATDLPAGATSRAEREWRVETTGATTTVNMKFDGFDDDWAVYTDADGDFTDGAVLEGSLNANGEITGLELADNSYFALVGFEAAPGGVVTDLQLWLKADTDVTNTGDGTITTGWADQVDTNNVLTHVGDPRYTEDGINFNPTVDLDGGDYLRLVGDTFTGDFSTGGFDVFYVTEAPNANTFDTVLYFGENDNDTDDGIIFGQSTVSEGLILGLNGSGTHTETEWSPTNITSDTHLWSASNVDKNNFNTTSDVHVDGEQKNSTVNAGVDNSWDGNTDNVMIGNARNNVNANCQGCRFNGEIAEVVAYSNEQGAIGRQKIQSYLAIKYGITLDDSVGEYIDTATTTVYDLTDGYEHDVFGIGKDANTALDQQISKSVNDGAIVTISTDTDFVGANGTHASLANGQYVVIGSNGATTTQTTDVPGTGNNIRPAREWKLDVTGSVDEVNLKFDGYDDTWMLYADDDGTFATGAKEIGMLNTDGEITFDVGTGANEMDDEQIFTLAKFQVAPGGVTPNLAFWVRGDTLAAGDITDWEDQSPSGADLTSLRPTHATVNANAFNFNTTANFTNDQRLQSSFSLDLNDSHNFFAVSLADSTPGAGTIASVGSNTPSTAETLRSDSNELRVQSFQSANVLTPFITEPQRPYITMSHANGVTNILEHYLDGYLENSVPNNTNLIRTGLAATLGAHQVANTANFSGDIAEVIYYDTEITPAERLQVESYLAIKYGITLDSSVAGYKDSSDGDIYTYDGIYDENIFGIARDDATALDQRVSKSVNDDAILTISTDSDFTSANATSSRVQLDDGDYLVIGTNAATTTATTTELQTGYIDRIEREWRAEVTGTIASSTINLQFDGFDDEWHLLTNGTGNFSSGVTSQGKLSATGQIASVPLTDGMYFTLARTPIDPVTIVTPTANSIATSTVAVTGFCEPGATVSIASSDITPDPTTGTCTASSTYDIDVDFLVTATATPTLIASQTLGSLTSATTSVTVQLDYDGDGVTNSAEDAGFNGGDGNGDGIPDSQQQDVSAAPNPVTGDYTTLVASGACTFITENAFVSESGLAVQDSSADYPVGLVDFRVECANPGDSSDVTIYYAQQYDTTDWTYKKYNSVTGNVYSDITALATFATSTVGVDTVTTVSFTVTDGDPQTDEDTGPADGIINDPSGPAIPVITSSGGGSGSSKRVCRDPEASNYKTFGKSDDRLCEYEEVEEVEVEVATGLRQLLGGAEPNVPAEFQGEVCNRYMRGYVFPGSANNDPEEVTKLQVFLNEAYGENLAVDGTYDADDIEAVKRYQTKHAPQILWPWDLTAPTANVYRTTVTKMNLEMCGYQIDGPYFTEYLQPGDVSLESVRVQDFINLTNAPTSGYPTNGLPLTKTFTPATKKAVIEYQNRYKKTVLDPWGLSAGTGWWYQTTRSSANALVGTPESEITLDNGKSHTAF